MSDMLLTKTRMVAGVWEGVLSGAGRTVPNLRVTHQDTAVMGVAVQPLSEPGDYLVTVPVPVSLISDGVQTFVISDLATGDTLDTFTLIAGEALADDLRAEIALLRAELDMLKRAFRRHCVETK